MIHDKRKFGIVTVESVGRLVEDLKEHSWTLCTGFALQDLPPLLRMPRIYGYRHNSPAMSESFCRTCATLKLASITRMRNRASRARRR